MPLHVGLGSFLQRSHPGLEEVPQTDTILVALLTVSHSRQSPTSVLNAVIKSSSLFRASTALLLTVMAWLGCAARTAAAAWTIPAMSSSSVMWFTCSVSLSGIFLLLLRPTAF